MAKVSIVLPVYNCGEYLGETLDALIDQTLQDIEIIIVNDGSKDDTDDICRYYQMKDKRIVYVKKENTGPSDTRNIGLSYANGEYIGFCDGDDIPNKAMYQTLYNYAIKNNSDIAMCDIYSERNNDSFGLPYENGRVVDRQLILSELIPKMIGKNKDDDKDEMIWGSVVRCIYRKDLIDDFNIRFPTDIEFAEDLVFTLQALANSFSVTICNQVLYFYRMNRNSLMMSHRRYQHEMFIKRKKLTNYIKDIANKLEMKSIYQQNILVSFRAYVHEAVGNACKVSKGRNIYDSYKELDRILNDDEVIQAFIDINCEKYPKRFMYQAIKKKQRLLLLFYYRLRFAQSNLLNRKRQRGRNRG